MIVCHCNGVSDRVVRAVIRDGAECVGDVTDACSAGGDCGGCVVRIQHLMAVEQPVALSAAC